MPQLPLGLSIIDVVIVLVFVFQIIWGAKLGFAMAAFSLAGEILAIVAAVLYSPTVAKLLDQQFAFVNQLNTFLADKTKIPSPQIESFQLGSLLFESLVFLVIFIMVQAGFFQLGKFMHHQVGVRRITYFSHSFFGMVIGALKATLEVTFALLAWNISTRDPNIQAALQTAGSFTQFGTDSVLLPIFQKIIPDASPFVRFFQ